MASYTTSKIVLPNGDKCNLKDREAREKVDSIIIMDSTARTIAKGTDSFNVSGLTADHVVARWQFSGNYTDNYPPADITVTTSNGSYTITASEPMSSGITMQPIFIKQ